MKRNSSFLLLVSLLLIAVPVWAAGPNPVERGPEVRLERNPAFHVDTYTVYELRIQRMETFWPDKRAVTTSEAGEFRTVLFANDGRQLLESRVIAPDPMLPVGMESARSVSGANAALARQYGSKGLQSLSRDAEEVMPDRVVADFGELVAESLRDPGTEFFRTFLREAKTGKVIGVMRWFADEQMFSWRFAQYKSLGSGYLTPLRLEKFGGWKTLPDMTWACIQALVFRDSYEHVRVERVPLENATFDDAKENCDGAPDGCTGLHWLDGTVYRACCDEHDRCYEYAPPDGCCTAWSWLFPTSWHCLKCNIQVVACFVTAGGGGGGGGGGCTGGGGGGGCQYQSGYCPPECRSCSGGWLMSECGY